MTNRFLLLSLMAGLFMCVTPACSEYDDSALRDEIESLKDRVSALEKDVEGLNTDVQALQATVRAIAEQDVVTGIRSIVENGQSGWEITFRDNGTVKIFLSRDGIAPRVGVTTVGGVVYWTVDGEILKDASGNPVPAAGPKGKDGVTPQFKIEDGWWYVSYGSGWVKLDKSYDATSMFRSVEVSGGNLIITLSDGTQLTIPVLSVDDGGKFDENRITLSIAAISDTHIGNGYGSEAKFTSALNQLKARAAEKDSDGLDAVMVVGDLINSANTSQITTFKTLYEQVFDPVKVPMIYTVGNHDMNSGTSWSSETVTRNAAFHNILGDDYFLTDQDQTARKSFECRHCIVGGYHILGITPNASSPAVVYDANATTWLNNQLKTITEAEPYKYVLLITHPMIHDTVYGSDLGTFWYTKSLTSILEGYPQVVTFGGHLHFPINDPRSIWQGKFTSFGCASTSYMAFEGGNYINKSSGTVLKDAGEYSEGLLLQFDTNGNMRATRMDFYRNAEIGTAWEIKAPKADRSHLETYNHTALKADNTAPALSTLSVEVGELSGTAAPVTAKWAAGTDDEFVHHYSYTLKKDGTVLDSKLIMSDFYRCPQTSMMKTEYSLALGNLEEGEYSFEVVAYDSWGKYSDPLVKIFAVGSTEVRLWKTDAAGSAPCDGGSGSVAGTWLSYASGTLSWTENTTGKPRSESITLPSGVIATVTQVEAKDFKGTWGFRAQRFSNNTNVISAAADVTFDITIGNAKYGETLSDVNGKSYTNNLGVNGLYLNAVADATVKIDYDNRVAQFGLFLDERKAQAVSNGKAGYNYVCFIPECATGWMSNPWNFVPVPIHASKNYTWLWFNVSNDLTTLNYDQPNKQYLPGTSSGANMIIGITCAVCTNAAPAASDINTTYDVIYQANPNKVTTNGGFTLKRK